MNISRKRSFHQCLLLGSFHFMCLLPTPILCASYQLPFYVPLTNSHFMCLLPLNISQANRKFTPHPTIRCAKVWYTHAHTTGHTKPICLSVCLSVYTGPAQVSGCTASPTDSFSSARGQRRRPLAQTQHCPCPCLYPAEGTRHTHAVGLSVVALYNQAYCCMYMYLSIHLQYLYQLQLTVQPNQIAEMS